MMTGINPRMFSDQKPGYQNASLGVAGIAIPFPLAATKAYVSVSAGCWVGIRPTNALATFSDTNYGSILNGLPYLFVRPMGTAPDNDYIHIAPWSATAAVAIVFG